MCFDCVTYLPVYCSLHGLTATGGWVWLYHSEFFGVALIFKF